MPGSRRVRAVHYINRGVENTTKKLYIRMKLKLNTLVPIRNITGHLKTMFLPKENKLK